MNDKRKLLFEAKEIINRHKNFSPSFLSRKLHIGYASALKIIKILEKEYLEKIKINLSYEDLCLISSTTTKNCLFFFDRMNNKKCTKLVNKILENFIETNNLNDKLCGAVCIFEVHNTLEFDEISNIINILCEVLHHDSCIIFDTKINDQFNIDEMQFSMIISYKNL